MQTTSDLNQWLYLSAARPDTRALAAHGECRYPGLEQTPDHEAPKCSKPKQMPAQAHSRHEHSSNTPERRCLATCQTPQVKPHSLISYKNKNTGENVGAPLYLALLIQQVQDPKLGLYQVYAGLVVIEVYQRPGDLLLHVLFLLQLKHVLGVGESRVPECDPSQQSRALSPCPCWGSTSPEHIQKPRRLQVPSHAACMGSAIHTAQLLARKIKPLHWEK